MFRIITALCVAVAIFVFFKNNILLDKTGAVSQLHSTQQKQHTGVPGERTASNPAASIVEPVVMGIQGFALRDVQLAGKPVLQDGPTRQKHIRRVSRSVQDCIKPGNLIDDDVQLCVNGSIEKSW